MKQISNIHELSSHLYEMIIEGKIRTFSGLIEYTGYIFPSPRLQIVLMSAFKLIRKLYWGFFKDIDYPSYPKIWKQIVVPDRKYKYAGDIKRSLTISSLYVAVLDVHGYTAFCRQNNRNLSMLQLLDDCIQGDIGKITQEHNVVSRRERGDEIILVGTTATDILNSVLSIVDYFSKRKVISNDALSRSRPGAKIILPDMYISAGIAGGKIYTPLIITEAGELSGDVINTAARLQARANKVSPSATRITVTKHIVFRYRKENNISNIDNSQEISFFNSGVIDFKGTTISLHEVIFREKDRYILQHQEEMHELYNSIRKKLWQNQIFPALITLIIKVCRNMSPFKIKLILADNQQVVLKNDDIIKLAEKALLLYSTQEDYLKAITSLRRIVDYLGRVQGFDDLVLDYAVEISRLYENVVDDYAVEIEKKIDDKYETLFSDEMAKVYLTARKQTLMYKKLKDQAMQNNRLVNRKAVWYAMIERNLSDLNFSIYSGKK